MSQQHTRLSRKGPGAAGSPAAEYKHPDRSKPKTPTLFDLAASREKELFDKARIKKGALPSSDVGDESPMLLAILYGVTLTSLNLTLDILVWHQYSQDYPYAALIFRNLATTLPILLLLVFVFHSTWFGIARFPLLRQLLFFCAALASGMYAVWQSNEGTYLAVMKKVPPAGTLWVWAVLEMGAAGGASSLIIVAIWAWWNGLSWT